MVANFCARWRAELAVQHDGLGIVSLPLSYGQLWIIAQHGSDTHQDAIVQAAKLMGKASGLGPLKQSVSPDRVVMLPSQLWA